VRTRIKTWNSSDAKPRQLFTDEVRVMLRDYFAEDVDKLSGLLARDLDHWKSGSGSIQP